jgi:trk system potassium uptake protein TrkH
VVQAILLLAGGMDFLEAVCIAFGTAGTGGFGVRNDSMAGFSPYIQWVVTIFMTLFGVNFGIYYLLLLRSFRKAFRNEELWMYVGILAIASVTIFLNILPSMPGQPADAFRHSCFQVASVMTTTGFGTVDFNLWPQFSKTILIMLMLIGASAGSTGGGMKVSRVIILAKSILSEIKKLIHPNSIKLVRVSGKVVSSDVVHSVNGYFAAYIALMALSMLCLSLDNFNFETTFSAVVACFNNIGPGFDMVGAAGNYSAFSDFGKLVLCADMLLGRLEIFPILLLFSPSLWRRTK